MTYDEALEFFARYGNVTTDIDRLRRSVATPQQLTQAAKRATKPPHDQPLDVAAEAVSTVLAHYDGMDYPRDQNVVRERIVNEMIDFWQRGETYTYPYTRAEVRAAERRWVAEERVCPSAPNRSPWAIQLGVNV